MVRNKAPSSVSQVAEQRHAANSPQMSTNVPRGNGAQRVEAEIGNIVFC